MHVVIINGSPRAQKYSNTEKIIAAFAKGLAEKGSTFETHAVSNRKTWDAIRGAYLKNDEILIALPLYVECVPGLLLEFLETLPKKDEHTRLNSDKVLFSFARGRERCDRNGHAVFLRPGVDFATTGSEITGISTSSTKLK